MSVLSTKSSQSVQNSLDKLRAISTLGNYWDKLQIVERIITKIEENLLELSEEDENFTEMVLNYTEVKNSFEQKLLENACQVTPLVAEQLKKRVKTATWISENTLTELLELFNMQPEVPVQVQSVQNHQSQYKFKYSSWDGKPKALSYLFDPV